MPDIHLADETHGTDLTVHYEEFGAPDRPPLLLVHGLLGDASTMAPLAVRLSPWFHVIAPDTLGHGRSTRPASLTLEDQGRMLAGLIAGLGYESAALVGISMGSYLAAQAAILAPDRASHLVLIASKAHGTTSSVAAYAEREGYDLSSLTPEEAMGLMAEAVWSPHTPQERRTEFFQRMAVKDPLSAEEQAVVERSLEGFDLRPSLSALSVPTLVVSGLDDGLNPPQMGRELADHIPGSRFQVYNRSGHMLAYEETDRLVEDLRAFLTD